MHYTHEPKFIAWKRLLEKNGCTIRGIEPHTLVHKRNGELLCALLKVDANDATGTALLPWVLVRGDAVVVVPLCINSETGEEKYCMIRQPRTGNGGNNLEFPAGMLDRNLDDPAATAARELEEETGIRITPRELVPLWERPLHTSVGLQDEAILFYGCIVTLDNATFRSLEGHATGEEAEGEHITVTLMTRWGAEQELCSTQVLLGMELFERKRTSIAGKQS